MDEFTYEIGVENAGERIDKFLSGELSELSRSYIQKLLKEGMVTLEGKAMKANYRLREKDEIEIKIPPAMEPDICRKIFPSISFMRTVTFWWSISLREWWSIPEPAITAELWLTLFYTTAGTVFPASTASCVLALSTALTGILRVPFWSAKMTSPIARSRNS